MKKLKNLVVAGILASSMALSALAPTLAVAAAVKPTEPIRLVTIGDSMTDGYGMAPYVDNDMPNKGFEFVYEGAYPDLLAKKLHDKYDREVELTQLAMNAIRTEDVQYLLEYDYETNTPAFEIDDYGTHVWYYDANSHRCTNKEIDYSHAYIAKKFQTSVKNADYITFGLGFNYFSMFWLRNMMAVIGGSNKLDYEFDLAEKLFGETPSIKAMAEKLYGEVRTTLLNVIGSSNEGIVSMVEKLGGALVYAYVGLIESYKACLDDIFALNPDVNITLISLSNLFRGITGRIAGVEFDMGIVLDLLMGAANKYIESLVTSYNIAEKLSIRKNYTINYVSSYTMPDGTKIDRIESMGENFSKENVSPAMEEQHKYLRGQYMINLMNDYKTPLENIFGTGFTKYSSDKSMELYEKYHGKVKADIGSDYNYNDALQIAIYEAFETVIKQVNVEKKFDLEPLIDVLSAPKNALKDLVLDKELSDILTATKTDGDFSQFIEKLGEKLSVMPGIRVALYVNGNFMFSDGMGIHPSDVGHQQYADAIFKAIVCKISAVDEKVIDSISGIKNLINKFKNAIAGSVNGWFSPKTNELFDLDTVLAVQTMLEEESDMVEITVPVENDVLIVPVQGNTDIGDSAIAVTVIGTILACAFVVSVKKYLK